MKATHILARVCLQNLRQISALACWFLPSFWASFLHLCKGEVDCAEGGDLVAEALTGPYIRCTVDEKPLCW